MEMEVVQEEIDMLIIVEEEGESDESPVISDVEEPMIKLQVLSNNINVMIIQLKGVFNKLKMVHVLVDSGTTYNFMHPILLKNLKAPMSNLLSLKMMLVSGARTKTQSEVNASLQLQGFKFSTNFCILLVFGYEETSCGILRVCQ